jgi:F0F1-type ATP synthase assembly protein I
LSPFRSTLPGASDPKDKEERDFARALREAAPLLSLGTTLAVTVAAALGLGYWLDARLGTRPWLLLAGGCLGVGAAMYQFIRTVTRSSNRRSDSKP